MRRTSVMSEGWLTRRQLLRIGCAGAGAFFVAACSGRMEGEGEGEGLEEQEGEGLEEQEGEGLERPEGEGSLEEGE